MSPKQLKQLAPGPWVVDGRANERMPAFLRE